MFRAGLKAGLFGAGVIALVQLLSFLLSLLPRTLGVSFEGCFFIVTLLVFVGAGAWAGQMLGRPSVKRGSGAGCLAGVLAGLAQVLIIVVSVALGIVILNLTGELMAMVDPADLQGFQETGLDPVLFLIVFMTILLGVIVGPIFLVLGAVLGALGGAVHAVIVRQAPALSFDVFDNE